jgi:hypothetical protein
MNGMKRNPAGAIRAIRAIAFAIGAGCTVLQPAAPEGSVVVTPIERVAWNTQDKPGLYRIRFDAQRAQALRRLGQAMADDASVGYATGEIRALEADAERELRARNLCAGTAKLVTYLDRADGPEGIGAVFQCLPTLF